MRQIKSYSRNVLMKNQLSFASSVFIFFISSSSFSRELYFFHLLYIYFLCCCCKRYYWETWCVVNCYFVPLLLFHFLFIFILYAFSSCVAHNSHTKVKHISFLLSSSLLYIIKSRRRRLHHHHMKEAISRTLSLVKSVYRAFAFFWCVTD